MHRRSFILSSLAASMSSPAADPLPRIRIGQIGTAHAHAAGKMDAIRKLSDLYEVAGIAEHEESRRASAARSKTYAGLRWLGEDELLRIDGLQAVAIENRIEAAPAAALRCIEAGKHIHLDKPGALGHGEFKQLRLAAESRGLAVQMGYMLRYNPAFELLFRLVREGALGEIHQIDASMGKLADPGTRAKLRDLPGGGMFELACHVIDAVVTLLGRPGSVTAMSTPSQPADGTKDNQLAVLEYAKATAAIRCDHADPFGGQHRRFFIAGSKGAVEILPLESGKLSLRLAGPCGGFKKGEQKIELPMPGGRYDGEFIDLAKVIRGEKKLAWDAAHDIAVHETVLRASGVMR